MGAKSFWNQIDHLSATGSPVTQFLGSSSCYTCFFAEESGVGLQEQVGGQAVPLERADNPGDEWWENQPAGAASSPEASDGEGGGDPEMQPETAPVPALSKKTKQPKECFLIQPKETEEDATKTRKRRKKKITDVLTKSEPKPGTPEDLQKLMKDYYSSNRSEIELEELHLQNSCFLKANDLTHSLSSYLKEICPKWVKLRKNHNEKKSVLVLIICSSAVWALALIRSMTAFRGDSKILKLFAKHIKVQEQVKLLEKHVVHLGVGSPGRIKELIILSGLNLNPLKFLIEHEIVSQNSSWREDMPLSGSSNMALGYLNLGVPTTAVMLKEEILPQPSPPVKTTVLQWRENCPSSAMGTGTIRDKSPDLKRGQHLKAKPEC
ncbi:uncharacterized protein C3orf26 homolog [Neovison vison]|uniref:uncharacterized protein C3orf26 homolog n=1 Tax=Neovison vison TaxID=452646 RepID=UPI001CEFF009|nr:uncharacterized protein C3orf26 homolog [Neogale vison]